MDDIHPHYLIICATIIILSVFKLECTAVGIPDVSVQCARSRQGVQSRAQAVGNFKKQTACNLKQEKRGKEEINCVQDHPQVHHSKKRGAAAQRPCRLTCILRWQHDRCECKRCIQQRTRQTHLNVYIIATISRQANDCKLKRYVE